MRLPLLYTLSWPERIYCSEITWPRLDLTKLVQSISIVAMSHAYLVLFHYTEFGWSNVLRKEHISNRLYNNSYPIIEFPLLIKLIYIKCDEPFNKVIIGILCKMLNLLTQLRLKCKSLRYGSLTFQAPDTVKFPSVNLCYAAGRAGGTMTGVISAANEKAVEMFVEEK